MKKLITLVASLISLNSIAYESSAYSSYLTFFSNGGVICKEAVILLNDVNSFNQNGEVSIFLATKIRAVQAAHPDLSDNEAIDLLTDISERIISDTTI
jgi:Tfp pilus assembly protein PilZ